MEIEVSGAFSLQVLLDDMMCVVTHIARRSREESAVPGNHRKVIHVYALPLPVWDRQAGKLVEEWMEDSKATYESRPRRSLKQCEATLSRAANRWRRAEGGPARLAFPKAGDE